MSVCRVNKNKDYTVMSNHHLQNKNLSLKAVGLLSKILSIPDDWNYTVSGLTSLCKENETAIKSALRELKVNGYLVVTKIKPSANNGGRWAYEYDFYEQPKEIQAVEIQGIENLGVENLGVENLPLYKSTNIQSTNILNTNILVIPKLEEVVDYCSQRQNSIDAEKFIDYYTANGWMQGDSKMTDWKSCVRIWERNSLNYIGRKEIRSKYDD